ncbi:MAG: carbamoyltransferase HypF [Bryobacteraceae bacterium]|nr:carbamoyltransferase HypF [Bryobacteraceae bacterium]MDW8380418.1 carbamoyltransferase HypF [Bryobacterales bacterium]
MDQILRRRFQLYGAVQGVGFRPFVYRLARELGLSGKVQNSALGAVVEVEGSSDVVGEFTRRLPQQKPPACVILSMEVSELPPAGYPDFSIVESSVSETKSAVVLPDLATCADCLAEIFDPEARRYGYAFTNCTNCGPRYTILESIPYDRANTTMRDFAMCADCRAEYENPLDRRFHAQPIACPRCGPQLNEEVESAARRLEAGEILAVKGIGGFQLVCDACASEPVRRLRKRKNREEKPFAVMFPGLDSVRRNCVVSEAEIAILTSPAAPILLLRPAPGIELAPEVSMGSPFVGAMLPYSPLHHRLLRCFGRPVVATSGNLSDEPIAIANEEAQQRLKGLADAFLLHNRPIARPCDDSVVRVTAQGRPMLLRRARGYAPLPVLVPQELPRVLAVGAHLKNTIAIAFGRRVFLSQHVGDLESVEAYRNFQRAIHDLSRLYEFEPEVVACDLHPDYLSTQYAEGLGLPLVRVQHHLAHVAACAAENEVKPPYLGVAWDGTGLGTDGAIWGSEFFLVTDREMRRVGHLRPFRLPGGDQAARDCRRVAVALLEHCGRNVELGLPEKDLAEIKGLLERGRTVPWTTSMGRLFDGVAALSGVALANRFEGQAPMKLEAAISRSQVSSYPVVLDRGELDWRPVVDALLRDRDCGVPAGEIAAKFHETAARWVLAMAQAVAVPSVVLSGGVFQNADLSARVVSLLEAEKFRVFLHQRVPPNDGGIALGQAVLAGASCFTGRREDVIR